MSYRFIGGVHVRHGRNPAKERPARVLEAPEQVAIHMSLHIGAVCTPCVQVGDKVTKGQKIGDSPAPVSAPVHSSVSGTVRAIEPRLTPLGNTVPTVIIDNDGLDTPCEDIRPLTAQEAEDPEELIKAIRACGIVGMGGATFPTAFKISDCRGRVDLVIVNGSECEPYIFSDHALMLQYADDVMDGIRLVCRACGVTKAILVVEKNKKDAVEELRRALPEDGSIDIKVVRTRYPQGAEKQLIRTVTGREVPPGGLPASIGCSVFNVATCYAVHEAVRKGMPLIERIVTVGGSAMAEPNTFIVPVGTPIRYVFEKAGGFTREVRKIVMGGPMMGIAQYDPDVPVTKGSNGLLAFSEKDAVIRQEGQCIRCGRCVEACPMRLLPTYLYNYGLDDDLDALERYHIMDCMECGACTYSCPARLYLTHAFKGSKARVRARNAERKARAAEVAQRLAQKEKEGTQ